MKNTILFKSLCIIGSLLICIAVNAQRAGTVHAINEVNVGTVLFNAGLGVGSKYENDYYNPAFGIKASAEWGLWKAGPGVITLGAEAGGSFSNGGYYDNYHSSTMVLAGRSAWHCGWNVRGLDTYGGFSTGVGIHHFRYTNDIDYSGTDGLFEFGGFLGASYFVTPGFGFNAEAGYDITVFQVGVVLKLR
jgi:hypothetical protein